MKKDYKTILQEILENLEKARITQDDFLLNNAEIEHLLDYIGSLKQENKHLDTVDCQLRQTIGQLRDNWNKLKEFIVKEYYMYLPLEMSTKSITILIDKMQELEQGSSNNE